MEFMEYGFYIVFVWDFDGIDMDFICFFLYGILMELIWILFFFCMEFMELICILYGFFEWNVDGIDMDFICFFCMEF